MYYILYIIYYILYIIYYIYVMYYSIQYGCVSVAYLVRIGCQTWLVHVNSATFSLIR